MAKPKRDRLLERSQKLYRRTLKTLGTDAEVADAIDRVDQRAKSQRSRLRKHAAHTEPLVRPLR